MENQIEYVRCHFNHAGAFNVAAYWFFFNAAGIRQIFDSLDEAIAAGGVE